MSKKKKGAIAGVAAAVVIVCAAGAGNATYTINEQEQAVVTTFGVSHAVTDPGLHFKIPFVQHVTKVNTTIQSLRIGYDNNNDVVADAGSSRSLHHSHPRLEKEYDVVNSR